MPAGPDGLRSFVVAADAAELARDPALLPAYVAAFGAADDVTLAVRHRGSVAELAAAFEAALPPGDEGPDLLALEVADDPAAERRFARSAHALYSRSTPPPALAPLPRFDDAGLDRLRALAARPRGQALSFAIGICAPRWEGCEGWGDLHYANAVAAQLRLRGHEASVQPVAEWAPAEIVLHLRGLNARPPQPGRLNVLWAISHPDLLTPAELDAYDLVLAASETLAERLAALTSTPVRVLLQATDPAVFHADPAPEHRRELVFVGNARGVMRRILADLLPTPHDLAVWGNGWQGRIDPRHVRGVYLPNEQVRRAYSSAAIVLNDHWDDMRAEGLVSNRIYDALACGALVVSDGFPELERRFGDAVVTYETRDELAAHVERLLADPAERAARGAAGRALVLAEHTFAHRVDALLDELRPLL